LKPIGSPIRQVSLTATSHESLQSLQRTYVPYIGNILKRLSELGATVVHEVDATALKATPELYKKKKARHSKNEESMRNEGEAEKAEQQKLRKFNVVLWNFPCLSLPAGADGQARELMANKDLMSRFFKNVHDLLRRNCGEVHVTHKTVEPFSWWEMKKLAEANDFSFAYAVIFDRYHADNTIPCTLSFFKL
jgi:hypothetical protein